MMIGAIKNFSAKSDATAKVTSVPDDSILVVDGEDGIRTTIRLALIEQGYTVDEAPTVASAYEKPLESYSMFIIDMKMDHMAGLELAIKLRNSPHTGGAPLIIFCSTKENERDIIRGLDAGADDYILRSFNLPTFLARVNALMRRHKRLMRR